MMTATMHRPSCENTSLQSVGAPRLGHQRLLLVVGGATVAGLQCYFAVRIWSFHYWTHTTFHSPASWCNCRKRGSSTFMQGGKNVTLLPIMSIKVSSDFHELDALLLGIPWYSPKSHILKRNSIVAMHLGRWCVEVKFHEEFFGDSQKSSYPWKDKFHLLVFGDSWKMDSNCNEMVKRWCVRK